MASGKPTRSCSITNLKTSPPSPHPKQWKTAGSERTLKEGLFSLWNGHRPFHDVPIFLRATWSEITRTMSAAAADLFDEGVGKGHPYSFSSTMVAPPPPSFAAPSAEGRHVRVALEELRDRLPELALAEAVDDPHLGAVADRGLVEELVHPGQRLVHGQADQVDLRGACVRAVTVRRRARRGDERRAGGRDAPFAGAGCRTARERHQLARAARAGACRPPPPRPRRPRAGP